MISDPERDNGIPVFQAESIRAMDQLHREIASILEAQGYIRIITSEVKP